MEGSNELRELKKEIIEARGLIIKSNNLANSYTADLRSISKRQTSYERHLSTNSYVVYIIIAIICFFVFQLAYNWRKASIEEELTRLKEANITIKAELAILKQEKSDKGKSGTEGLDELYLLISEGQRQESIDEFDKIDRDSLTALERKLLNDAIDGFRSDLSMAHYSLGLERIKKHKFGEAVIEFRQSLSFKDDSGHAKAAKIQMSNALRLQGKPREAIAVLQQLIEDHLDKELSDDAYWYLALSHYEAHQKDEARSVLRALMRQFPDSQYYRAAKIKAAEIQIHLYSGASKKSI